MNLQAALAMLQKFDPKGFNELDTQLTKHLTAAADSLTVGQVFFVKNNLHTLPAFFETPQGKTVIQTFVEEWQASLQPKA